MRPEQRLWAALNRGMKPYWVAQRVEDRYAVGVPDVYYALRDGLGRGWLELKVVPREPRDVDAPLVVRGFTPVQRAWLARFWREGGTHLLLRVARRTFLLRGLDAGEVLDATAYAYLADGARYAWDGPIDHESLAEVLATPW